MVISQFDVFRNRRDRAAFPFLLVVQHDLLSELPVRMVVPLTPRRGFGGRPVARLNPVFQVGNAEMVMLTQLMGAVRSTSLREHVGSLAMKRAEIIAALDVLISGV